MTKLVLAAVVALAVSTAAMAQRPERLPLLTSLPADATTIADYYKQNVYDTADQKIGQIVDLLVEKDGRLPAAMISVGGFLGIGQKNVAVPFAALQLIEKRNKPYLILDTDKKTLTAAPGFKYNRQLKRWQVVEED